jgi:hypothetical protein
MDHKRGDICKSIVTRRSTVSTASKLVPALPPQVLLELPVLALAVVFKVDWLSVAIVLLSSAAELKS